MEKDKTLDLYLTNEEIAELDEIYARYIAGPIDHSLVTFTVNMAAIREWLLNKYRAYYDFAAFIGSRTDENFSREKAIDREVFASALMLYTKEYIIKRLEAIINSSVQGLVTEIHESQRLIVEAALGQKKQDQLYPYLLSGKRMDDIWLDVIRDHLDPKFLKGRGGKKPKANLTRLYENYERIIDDWVEASELFRSARKSRSAVRRDAWRKDIQRNFSDLPEDLIERLQPMTDWPEWIDGKGGEDKPEDIALEHAARLCGAKNYIYKLSTLRETYNKQKRAKFESEV